MGKKYLRKNEIREDLNKNHRNKYGANHMAYISARIGKKLKANTRTHADYINGVKTFDVEKNSPNEKEHIKVSPPFYQNINMFGPPVPNKKIPKMFKSKIQRYNRKFNK